MGDGEQISVVFAQNAVFAGPPFGRITFQETDTVTNGQLSGLVLDVDSVWMPGGPGASNVIGALLLGIVGQNGNRCTGYPDQSYCFQMTGQLNPSATSINISFTNLESGLAISGTLTEQQ